MRECDIRSVGSNEKNNDWPLSCPSLSPSLLLHSADIMNTSCESRFSKYETSLRRWWHSQSAAQRRGRNHNMSHAMKGGGAERGKGERGGSQGGAIRPLSSNPRFLSN